MFMPYNKAFTILYFNLSVEEFWYDGTIEKAKNKNNITRISSIRWDWKQRQEYGSSKIKQQKQKRILIRHVSPENRSIQEYLYCKSKQK